MLSGFLDRELRGADGRRGDFIDGISHFEKRLASAALFGITSDQLTGVIRWGQLAGGRDFGFPTGFYRLSAARRGTEWITLPAGAFAIFGLGLYRSLAPKFLSDTIRSPGCIVPQCVGQGQDLSPEGTPLRHELLNTEGSHPCHSWICNGLEHEFADQRQVTLNPKSEIGRGWCWWKGLRQ